MQSMHGEAVVASGSFVEEPGGAEAVVSVMSLATVVLLELGGAPMLVGAVVLVVPPAAVADAERARAVVAAARGTRTGASLDDSTPICFGGHERGSLLPDGVVVISNSLDLASAAARLIHLRIHLAEGLHRFPATGISCDRQMEEVIAVEARAIAAEIAACDELRCADPPYSFAAEVLAAAPDERVGGLMVRLRREPATDGLDAMIRRYRTRCKEAQ